MLGFVKSSSIPCYPYMCLIYLDCSVLLSFLFSVSLLQRLLTFCFYLYTPLCCCHHLFFLSSSSSHFLFCFSPTWCHPSPPLSSPLFSTSSHLPPPTPDPSRPCLSLRLPSITVSQRHSQTGGGVKRWWAPGNPRGAFQWQRPQVKIPWAELLGCSSRLEEK